jgi:hypothetical protein
MCDIEATVKKVIESINNEPSEKVEYQFNENVYLKKDALSILENIKIALNSAKISTNKISWYYLWEVSMCFFLGDYIKAKLALINSIESSSNEQQKTLANKFSNFFGFNCYYNNWKTLETEHIIFHYCKSSDIDINNFVNLRELAFKASHEIFKSALHRKIDFFIWDSRDEAHSVLNRYLGFAIPQYYLIHSARDQSPGHELTHIITHYIPGARKKTSLISEGVAVMMDQVNNDKAQLVRLMMLKNDVSKVDIKALWDNFFSMTTQISYSLAGVFVKALLDEYGKSKLVELLKNQSYDNACTIYGKDNLNRIIKETESRFNND